MTLEGKVVLITGASEGIGAACAHAFRASGARLSLTARSEENMRRLNISDAVITPGDLTCEATRRRAVASTVERFGRIDVLVNNAGMGIYSPAWRASMDDTRRMFELNFFAPLALIQEAVPHMRAARCGTIVNVGSIGGKITLPWMTLYSASKYALGSLTDGLRMELKGSGIHAMTVCPGYVKTGFQDHALGAKPPRGVRQGRNLAITPEACAGAIVRGVERQARTVVTPRIGWLFIALERLLPRVVDARMSALREEETGVRA